MFFKTSTIYKVYGTRKGAERYITKTGLDYLQIEEIGGSFFVVA